MTDSDVLEIVKDFKDNKGNFISAKINKHNLFINNIDLYNYLINRYNDTNDKTTISEIIYRIENNIETIPLCPVCQKPLNFIRYCKGYQIFCSTKCKYSDIGHKIMENKAKITFNKKYGCDWSLQSNECKEKAKETYLKKYGVTHSSQSDIVKQHSKNTCLEKYGVEYTFQSDNNKEKAKETYLKKYGVNHPMKAASVKQHYKETCIKKYNTNLYINTNTFKEKSLISRRKTEKKKWKERGYDIDYIGNGNILVHNCCTKHGDVTMHMGTFYNRIKLPICLCTKCNPIVKPASSYQELYIENFLKENNINYILHDRKLLGNNKELDFYIPDYNLAIECNGIFWHSEAAGHNKYYHQEKSKLCEAKGVQLLHIWEDDFNNIDLILDLLKIKLHMKDITKIYARKCVIKEIDSKTSTEFINNNHLQGNINASIKLGLFYNNELVQVMTFGKLRKALGSNSKEYNYELYRLCSLKNHEIIGGAAKLLAYFKNNYKWQKIVSYAKYDISNGNLYNKLGFTFEKITEPNYYWVNRNNNILKRENRFKYRKSELFKLFDKTYDTEILTMYRNGYYRCFDSGNKKYVLINEIKK